VETLSASLVKFLITVGLQSYMQYQHPEISHENYPEILPPRIVVIEHSQLQLKAQCTIEDCKIMGWYSGFVSNDKTIYLSKNLPFEKIETDAKLQSIIFHELIHYIQDEYDHAPKETCKEKYELERVAYTLQARFVQKKDYTFAGIRIPPIEVICKDSE
jgi:hypothetical protein